MTETDLSVDIRTTTGIQLVYCLSFLLHDRRGVGERHAHFRDHARIVWVLRDLFSCFWSDDPCRVFPTCELNLAGTFPRILLIDCDPDSAWNCHRLLPVWKCPRSSSRAVLSWYHRSFRQLARNTLASSRHDRHRVHARPLLRTSSQDRSWCLTTQLATQRRIEAIQSTSRVQTHGVSQCWLHPLELRLPQFLAVFFARCPSPDPRQYVPLDVAFNIRPLLHCTGRRFLLGNSRWWSTI